MRNPNQQVGAKIHAFRAYSLTLKRMLRPDELARVHLRLDQNGNLLKPHDLVLMAFTGKGDMHKKPIYEQDIVDVDIPNEFGSLARKRGIMVWQEPPGHYTIHIQEKSGLGEAANMQVLNACVVGNTLEDRELMKEHPKPFEGVSLKKEDNEGGV